MDETPQEEKKQSAVELLNDFMKEHKIKLNFGEMYVRQMKDGAILIEKPTVTAEFT